jgi:3-phosphoshikimate 1-carboxyvinyltransferase
MTHTYPTELPIAPLPGPLDHTVSVPGSKSITNRALVLAAVADRDVDCRLVGALRSEDTEVMVACLATLGIAVREEWEADPPALVLPAQPVRGIPAASADLFVANSGTTVRFLTALAATGVGRYRLDGVSRMRERPIQDLLDALNQFPGIDARSEAGTGCPPVVVRSNGLAGGRVTVRAGVSSQFLSALLMASPAAAAPVEVRIDGPAVSEPYIEMTVAMMRQWGYAIDRPDAGRFVVAPHDGHPGLERYAIEPDASAASYFLAAAAILGGRVTVAGLRRDMLQGDVRFADVLGQMGCRVEYGDAGVTVVGGPLRGVDVDMNAISDTVMTLAAVAVFADGPTTIRNVAHVRHKETDRIAAVATELRKLGAAVDEFPDGLRITPRPLVGCAVDTYRDHRMAMSLALVGLRVPGVVVRDPGCVAKTYPGFWHDLDRLRG